MDWKKVAKNVASLAPGIGAAVGGPAGSVAGLGIRAICGMFGVEPDAPDAADQVESALGRMTPDQAVKLKELDINFQKDMKALDVDVFKLEVEDRGSARKMQIETSSLVPGILAALVIGGWLALNYALIVKPDTVPNKDIVLRLLGTVDAAVILVLSFYFGAMNKRSKEAGAK